MDAAPERAQPASGDFLETAKGWIAENANESTVRTYNTYQKQFITWCEENDVPLGEVQAAHVVCWMRELVDRGLAVNTINSAAVSAVADLYRYAEKSPTRDSLVQAAKRVVAKTAVPPSQKLPLTREMLVRMSEQTGKGFVEVRDMFLVLLLFSAMLRESELASLGVDDVWEETLETREGGQIRVLFVFVEQSKTDQVRRGHTIVVSEAKDPRICPVRWFRAYGKLRRADALFLFHSGSSSQRLANKTPNGRVKILVESSGEDSTLYGSHSGRSGGATAATEAGIELRLVMKHGNWRSDAVFRYIRDSPVDLAAVSRAILDGK